MNVNVEKLEKSMAKLTIEVDAADFDKAIDKVYRRDRNRISVPGFRRGKAPRKFIEKMYGAGIFYQDAANDLINETFPQAVEQSGEEVTSNLNTSKLDVTQIEEGKPFIYTVEVAVKPEIKLGKYKGVEVRKRPEVTVTEDEVEAELKRQQDANGKIVDVTDRPVKDGDMIKLDYEGKIDGTPFQGGTAQDTPLTIGSHSFIPGFEEGLIGAEIGKTLDVNVTFPENYQAKELAGKAAVFTCTVKSIQEKQLPELNDEFADEVSEFSTLDELKKDIEKNIRERKEANLRTEKENEAVDAVIADAELEIPEPMLKTQQEQLANEFAQQMQMQGLQFSQYLQYAGITQDQFLEQVKPQAEKRIRTRLALEAIVKAENITVSDEEFQAELEKMAKQYNMPVDNVKKIFEEGKAAEDLKKDIAVQKAVTFVADNAKEVEKEEKPAEKTDAAADAEKKDAE
ncbi:MAG: trigger factor [Lachnospiraceae bacterium]|nr:trigger factor [Lachnospiraceae bacterium]